MRFGLFFLLTMQDQELVVGHAGEVVYYIMCFASDGFTCIGGGKSDHCCPGSHSGLQAVERIFKDVGVFGVASKISIPSREAVGSRFGTGKHLSGQDAVYHSFKFGVGIETLAIFSSLELVTTAIFAPLRRRSAIKASTRGCIRRTSFARKRRVRRLFQAGLRVGPRNTFHRFAIMSVP